MQFTKFGQSGLTVSRMILGTGTFGKQTDEVEAHRMLDRAADAGINFIDTADIYPPGAEAGASEATTGRWLSDKRSRFILATKGGAKMGPAVWDAGNSRKHILDAVDASLRRLKTDYVDLYQPHGDDPATPLDETVEAMDTIVRSGKSRYIGVSNFLRLPSGEGARKAGCTETEALCFSPTTLQSFVPEGRARTFPVGSGRRTCRHSIQSARWWPSKRQI